MTSFSGIEVQVMSTHVDLFGHLNHARYLEYLEWARFAWAAHHGFPIEKMVEEGYGPAIVRANVTWRRECRLGDKLRVTVQPLSARRGIGKLHQEVWKGEELCLEAEMSFVMFDLKARKALELPETFLALVRE
ncbi:MAG TPA: thioesterase family protein [Myxococcota bacterium]|nr:thioesterase family protein [Myxococcota bacterium]HND30452.1 thioesterase family protein [Myxococcota bacterium]HNH46064.1 thioesterase family protein [Myxococcota bacterium]